MAYYPIYATLRSFGAYTFNPHSSYLMDRAMARTRPRAALLGHAMPADAQSGGVGLYANPRGTWEYWIVAPQGAALNAAAGIVEAEYNALMRLLETPNSDGSTGEIQILTVYDAAEASLHHATAALTDASPTRRARGPYHLQLTLVFGLYTEFS